MNPVKKEIKRPSERSREGRLGSTTQRVDVRGSPDCGQMTWARRESRSRPSKIQTLESERNTSYTTKNAKSREEKNQEDQVTRKKGDERHAP